MSNSDLTRTTHDATANPYANRTADADDPILEIDGVTKRYAGQTVVDDLSLAVGEGELLTLLGPSGCGKTTTLRLIAGLEEPSGGAIRLRDEPVADGETFVEPERRGIGVVFQEFALFPHMTAEENVAFGLKEWPEAERERRVDEMLELVDLEEHREKSPDHLSGGQQQRVALARSLAPEPEILLLDEPFSNLDVDLRVQMREEVRRILKEAGVTAISVTHDQEEAMSVSDRIAVMNAGRIEQVGRPDQVFQHPESRFVAAFLGHASFLSGTVDGDVVRTDVGSIDREQVYGLSAEYDETEIDVLVRPDDIAATVERDGTAANGTVVYRRYLGPTVLYRVELDSGGVMECMHNHTERIDINARVSVELEADHELAWFPRANVVSEREQGTTGGK